jgi:hypothetical protein
MDESHVYHHNDAAPRIDVKVERNSRGYNYEAKVSGASSVDEAMSFLGEAERALKSRYGGQEKPQE